MLGSASIRKSSFESKFAGDISALNLATLDSFCCLILMMRLVLLCFILTLFIEMKYVRWSEIVFNNIPAIRSERRCEHLHKKLSMRVQFLFENLVGSVIFGGKLMAVTASKYSLKTSFSKTLSKSMS